MVDADDSLPRLLGGRYRLEAKLGSGGMGVVYRATDLTMQRHVAVKLIRGVDGVALDEEVASRFLREAKNTARIQHENIIEVFDFGRSEEDDMFFVMELLEGESLSAKLRREGKLSPEVGVHIVRQMCAALHVAHSAGIIHRDLKPANVMLIKRAGDASYVKVLDFGVAKSYGAPDQQTDLTHTGMLVGTVEYMAPEQIMGKKVDGRTDIYALGVVMYRMFAGKAPFRDGGVPALIHAHLNVLPKPITETASEVPGALDRVVLRCLAKRPEQRYESMEELSRALAAAIEPEDLGLVSLEYDAEQNDGDIYSGGDKTEFSRPPIPERGPTAAPRPLVASAPPAPPAPPARVNDAGLEDATIRIDRRDSSASASARRVASADVAMDRTAVMTREEVSTAKRAIPEGVVRFEPKGPRECAMCHTMNPPHSRACNACGVSLAVEEQAAVRARVTAPRTAHHSAPHIAPPTSGAFPFNHSPPHGVPHVDSSRGAPHGGWGTGSGPVPVPAQTPAAQPPSMWQRFLSWTGLRGR